jgi:hypothetical protein
MNNDMQFCKHVKYNRKRRDEDADGIEDVIFVDYICCDCKKVLASASYCISADYMDVYDSSWGKSNGFESGPL